MSQMNIFYFTLLRSRLTQGMQYLPMNVGRARHTKQKREQGQERCIQSELDILCPLCLHN